MCFLNQVVRLIWTKLSVKKKFLWNIRWPSLYCRTNILLKRVCPLQLLYIYYLFIYMLPLLFYPLPYQSTWSLFAISACTSVCLRCCVWRQQGARGGQGSRFICLRPHTTLDQSEQWRGPRVTNSAQAAVASDSNRTYERALGGGEWDARERALG